MNIRIILKHTAGVLMPYGYVQKKKMFYRRLRDIFAILDYDKSSYSNNYNIRIGLYLDQNNNMASPPPYHQTHISQSLSKLMPGSKRESLLNALDLESELADAVRIDIISAAILEYGVPFLDNISTYEGINSMISMSSKQGTLVCMELKELMRNRAQNVICSKVN